MTRDVGTQSTPPYISSTSPSPASTPSITERSKPLVSDSPNSNAKSKSEEEVCATNFSPYIPLMSISEIQNLIIYVLIKTSNTLDSIHISLFFGPQL